MGKLKQFVTDNGLSLLMLALFVGSLAGQVWSGVRLYNETQALHGLGAVGVGQYVRSGVFLQGVFSNWQAALLQLGSLIVFGIFLHQRGAPHSRTTERSGEDERGPKASWLRRNSLSVTFGVLFVLAFAAHLFSGAAQWNQEQALVHQPGMTVLAFAGSAKFWFSTFQTWEAEYMAIALYVLLSVVLRQEGSPESKPSESGDEETGIANK